MMNNTQDNHLPRSERKRSSEDSHPRRRKDNRKKVKSSNNQKLESLSNQMCVRIWLEVGHACEPRRSASGRELALDWRLWVRGVNGQDISAFVHKVVFHLHPASAFVYPKRVRQEPPYEIQESGSTSIDIPIHVYLKFSSKKIRLRYSLLIENNTKSNSESRCIFYDFENPPDQLMGALMLGGGEVIARTSHVPPAKQLVVLSDSGEDKPQKAMKTKKYKFVEPIPCKHATKRAKPYTIEDICSKCGDSLHMDIKKQLRTVSMTEEEITQVSQLYLSYSVYEKSVDALTLPPLSDTIYTLPELPLGLQEALKGEQFDYGL